jgi:hypothetical protein
MRLRARGCAAFVAVLATAIGRAQTPDLAHELGPNESTIAAHQPRIDGDNAASFAHEPASVHASAIEVHRHHTAEFVLADRRAMEETQPPLRGFRALILQDDATELAYRPWPRLMPSAEHTHPVWRSADLVAHRLARDGLLLTTANVLAIWHASESQKFAKAFAESKLDALRGAGLPVDLLPCFAASDDSAGVEQLIAMIEGRIAAGATPESMEDELARIPFRFRASATGFRASSESGEHDVALVRLQLTSGSYWSGAGDGGCLDLARQLATTLPDARFIASIEEKHLERFLETARAWPISGAHRFTVVPEPLPVAQWAQDNGKPGVIEIGERHERELATLVPRYASRGEDGAIFVPGETFVIDGFASTGRRVVQSPLLFQGGDLLVVREPVRGERILFAGEAEIHRNTALGLTREQALDALRVELGVDRCVVLPAVSFHIDCELCLRAVGRELLAFVNDTPAAARIVFECGLAALEKHGDIDAASARDARTSLAAGGIGHAVEIASRALVRHLRGPGRFAESFAQTFSSAAWDSGAGNLETFLLALDLLQSETVRPRGASIDPNTAEYLASLHRREIDRASLVKVLVDAGCTIVRVPSFSDGGRGINYVNGIHTSTSYWMPSHGGFFAPLDRAAQFQFEAALGADVKIVLFATSESQRRAGALHCSVSVFEAP